MTPSWPLHVSVMIQEVLAHLGLRPGGVWLDAGCGPGGYALEMLKRSAPDGKVIALDVDDQMLAVARERLASYLPQRCTLVRSNYSRLGAVLSELGIGAVDGISIDCGLARDQILGAAGKGLSFDRDEPLDMRLDPALPISAADLLNSITEHDLRALLRDLGDVREAGRIAAAIARRRARGPITTTAQLAATIEATVTAPPSRGKIRNPAVTKTFLALRVAINAELPTLEQGIRQAVAALRHGSGRLVVVAYHGGEDRIVKRLFRAL
jgi:16S rRNA (cytosine1402-N4)-methyltransferase